MEIEFSPVGQEKIHDYFWMKGFSKMLRREWKMYGTVLGDIQCRKSGLNDRDLQRYRPQKEKAPIASERWTDEV